MKQSQNEKFDALSRSARERAHENEHALSVAFEMISKYEAHPSTEELNGVDLKQLYKWMANMLSGYPVDINDGPTKEFLRECYKVMIRFQQKKNFTLFIA